MANDKEVIKKLLKIAENQQKIISKLAQVAAPANELAPANTNKREADTILGALPPQVKGVVQLLEVHPSHDPSFDGEVRVRFVPGKGSDVAFSAVQKTVQSLSGQNLLPGGTYMVKEV